jgi:hypothetical protein
VGAPHLRPERAALIPHLFGQSSACSAKKEHLEHESDRAAALISAGFRKTEQIGSGAVSVQGVAGSNPVSPTKVLMNFGLSGLFSSLRSAFIPSPPCGSSVVRGNPPSFYWCISSRYRRASDKWPRSRVPRVARRLVTRPGGALMVLGGGVSHNYVLQVRGRLVVFIVAFRTGRSSWGRSSDTRGCRRVSTTRIGRRPTSLPPASGAMTSMWTTVSRVLAEPDSSSTVRCGRCKTATTSSSRRWTGSAGRRRTCSQWPRTCGGAARRFGS